MGSSQSSPQKKTQNNDHQTVDKKIIVVPADMVVVVPADVVAVALVGWSLIKLMALVGWGLIKLVSSSSGSRSDEKIMKTSGCGKLEMNTDGSVTNSQEGFGAVIRNESGFCIMCFYGRVRDDCLIMEPELRAIYEGLKIIQGSDPAELDTHEHGTPEMMQANHGRLIRWRFSACGKLKMNTDGSVKNRKGGFGGRAGFGGVIRDERGFCIMCFYGCGKLEINTDGSVTNTQEGFGGVIRDKSGFCIMCFYGRVRDDCLIMEPELRAIYEGLKIIQGRNPAGLEEELDIHDHGTPEMMQANHGRLIRWRFPACGKLKMNTDGSVKNRKGGFGGRAGFGGVIRDERGFCIMCFYGTLGDDCLILEAELWAIYKGLKIIQGRNLREVEIESDSKEAINLIKNVKNDHMKSPFMEIKAMLLNTGCTLEHTLREGNRVADKLAKLGRDGDSNFVSFDTPPKEIWSLLDADVASAGFVRGAR